MDKETPRCADIDMVKAGPRHLNNRLALLQRVRKGIGLFLVAVMCSMALVSPASAGTLTNIGVALMDFQSGGAVNARFTTATTSTLSEVRMSVPAGADVSPGNRALLLSDTTNGNYASTPSSTNNNLATGDLDIRAKVAYPDWYSGTTRYVVAKRNGVGSYGLTVDGANQLEFSVWSGSGVGTYRARPLPSGWSPGSTHWLRLKHNIASGIVDYLVSDDGYNWTSLGTRPGPTSRRSSVSPLEIGTANGGGNVQPAAIHRVELRNAIDGPIKQVFDAADANRESPLNWNAPTGETWTVHQSGGNDVRADIGGDLSVLRASGLPAGGRAQVRLGDGEARYSFPSPQVVNGGTQVNLGLGGIVLDPATPSWSPVITTRNGASDVDTATAPTIWPQEPQIDELAGERSVVPTTDVAGTGYRLRPMAMTSHGGYLYVADHVTMSVLRIDPATGMMRRVAGNGVSGWATPGVLATQTSLSNITGLAFGSNGDLYIAENGASRVLRVDHVTQQISVELSGFGNVVGIAISPAGDLYVSSQWEDKIVRSTGPIGSRTPSDWISIPNPAGLAFAPNGDLYIAQPEASRVSRVANGTSVVSSYAGTGAWGNEGNGGPAANAKLMMPQAVSVDGSNRLLIADHRASVVRKVNLSTHVIDAFAGSGTPGFTGDGGLAVSANLDYPYALAAVGTSVFVGDSDNGRVRKVESDVISTLAGRALITPGGPSHAGLYSPVGLSVDANSNVFVANHEMSAVSRVDAHDRVSVHAGVPGLDDHQGDGGPATAAAIHSPTSMVTASDGSLYIVERYWKTIRKVAPNGSISTFASGFSDLLYGMTLLPQGDLATNPNNDLLLVAMENGTLVSVSPVGVIHPYAGDPGTRTTGGDGGPFANATFNMVRGLATGNDGSIYLIDENDGRVRRIKSGAISTVAGGGGSTAENAAAVDSELEHPLGVAVDPAGRVFVTESWRNRVRTFLPGGNITTLSGALWNPGDSGDGGSASSALFQTPDGLAIRGSDLLVTDRSAHRVRVVKGVAERAPFINNDKVSVAKNGHVDWSINSNDMDHAGMIDSTLTDVVSSPAHGTAVITKAKTYGEVTRVRYTPMADYVGTDSFTYRACDNTRALCANATVSVTVGEGEVRTVTGGATEGWGSGGNAPASKIVATDRFVYEITDGTKIHRVDLFSSKHEWFAGNGTNFVSGDGGPATAAGIGGTNALTIGARGELYLLNSTAGTIRMIDTNGVITTVAGTKGGSTTDGTAASAYDFTGAVAITRDRGSKYGALYVAFPNKIVYVNTLNNWAVVTVVGTGTAGSSGDGGPAASAQLNGVSGLATSSSGSLYIADTFNHAIRRYGDGLLTTAAGTLGVSGNTGDGGPAASARLNQPTDVAFDDIPGHIYVSDKGNNRVRRFANGSTVSAVAGSGAASGSLNDGPAATARIASPVSVAIARTGTVLVAEGFDGSVRQVKDGSVVTISKVGAVTTPQMFSRLDPNSGNGFTTQGNDVFVNADVGRIAKSNADRVNLITATGADTAAQNKIQGMAVDPATSDVYYTDTDARQVKKITSAGAITTIAGTGASGSTGDGSAAAGATFIEPYGIARASDGTLYVVDRGAHNVRKFIPGGNISTLAGTGTAGFSGDGGQATSAQFNSPTGVALDAYGSVYVADTNNHRVRQIDRFGAIGTVIGNGNAGSTLGTRGQLSELNAPTALAVGTDGDVYVGDNSGYLRMWDTAGRLHNWLGSGTKGFVDNTTTSAAGIGQITAMSATGDYLYFLDRDASRIRRVQISNVSNPMEEVSVHVTPVSPGNPQNKVLVKFSVSTTINARHAGVELLGLTGTPSVTGSYGFSQVPTASYASNQLGVSFAADETIRPNTIYAVEFSGMTAGSNVGVGQTYGGFRNSAMEGIAYGRTNLIDTSGPGNMPAFGQAGFGSPVRASSIMSISGSGKVALDPGATTSGSTTRSVTSSGNLNGQRVSVNLGTMTSGGATLPMLGNTGIAPASQPSNTWGIGVSGGAGTPAGRWSGGQLAGTNSGAAQAYFGMAVGSPFTISTHAKVNYLQPSGRYQSVYVISAERGH